MKESPIKLSGKQKSNEMGELEQHEPLLFKIYPNLREKVPWIPLLTGVPTPVDRLKKLEKHLNLSTNEIYIKRDDKDHNLYGGNKVRKFEFVFGEILKKKKKGFIAIGGIGTNHGVASAIFARDFNLKVELFVSPQPLNWHIQRSLILHHHFGANLHLSKGFMRSIFKALLFKFFHPKYYLMPMGCTPFLGIGSSLGTVGLINAVFELKEQIEKGVVPEPDIIFIAGGTVGTASGLAAGCKSAGLKTKVHVVKVSVDVLINPSNFIRVANMAIKYLRKQDSSIPDIKVTEEDFSVVEGYLGSDYGIKTVKAQEAVDIVTELEGNERDFKLDTTYTGKTMAALIDFVKKEENNAKKVLFWNTYNSNNLDGDLRETKFDFTKLPKKFHKFYEKKLQCWQITECPPEIREKCEAYLNHEYRFWKIPNVECKLDEEKRNKAREELTNAIKLENA